DRDVAGRRPHQPDVRNRASGRCADGHPHRIGDAVRRCRARPDRPAAGRGVAGDRRAHALLTARPVRAKRANMARIGIVPFWKSYDRPQVVRTARLAEELGYDSIWIPEAWAYEQFQLLAEIALATRTLRLATGIANVFSRSPGLLAMSAATLDEI